MQLKNVFDYVLYLFVRAFLFVAGRLPLSLALWVGRVLGSAGYMLGATRRGIALDSISSTVGQGKTEAQVTSIAKAFYKNLGMTLMEFARFLRIDKAYIEKYVAFEGEEHALRAVRKGKGVIFLMAHFGNWELLCYALPLKGFKGAVVVRPLDNKYVNALVERKRKMFGTKVLDKGNAMRGMLGVLKDKETLGVLLDQRSSRKEGVEVEFLGRQALTNKGLATLVMKTGAVVVPTYIVREDGPRHRVVCEAPVEIIDSGNKEDDIKENTQRFSHAMEKFIRQYPDHWLWFHSRWERRKRRKVNA